LVPLVRATKLLSSNRTWTEGHRGKENLGYTGASDRCDCIF